MENKIKEKFWSKVDIKGKDSCWEWMAGKTGGGYGAMQIKLVKYLAHRLSWYFTFGYFPNGLLRHSCDNPGCVNPNHLLNGSDLDNVMDRVNRNRSAIGECNGRSKLTERQVKEIKGILLNSNNINKIAKEYNVSSRTISFIRDGITWKYLLS